MTEAVVPHGAAEHSGPGRPQRVLRINLRARLRAALRKDQPAGAAAIALGGWTIDLVAYTATREAGAGVSGARQLAHLTPTEWRLLELLLRRPGQLVPARLLLTSVWGPGYERSTNYLRFHMARLRRKLEDDPSRPRYLLTEPGMGYRYQPDGMPPGFMRQTGGGTARKEI